MGRPRPPKFGHLDPGPMSVRPFWASLVTSLGTSWNHMCLHFGLLVANLAFGETFWVHPGLPFGLRAQCFLEIGLPKPPSIQCGTAECAERLNPPSSRLRDVEACGIIKAKIQLGSRLSFAYTPCALRRVGLNTNIVNYFS